MEIDVLRTSWLDFGRGRIFSLIPTSLRSKNSRLDDFLRPLIVRIGLLLHSSTLFDCVVSSVVFVALEVVVNVGRRGKAEIERGRRSAFGTGVFRELESLILSDRFRVVPGVGAVTFGVDIVLRLGIDLDVEGVLGIETDPDIRREVEEEAKVKGAFKSDSVDGIPDFET